MTNRNENEIERQVILLLKEKREKLGLSYGQLAELTNLHRTSISLIERGERHPTLLNCIKIADALDTDLSKIIKIARKESAN